MRRERICIYLIQAPNVDRDRGLAVPSRSATEGANAAHLAEEVMNHFLVELVVGQRIFALKKGERFCRNEA